MSIRPFMNRRLRVLRSTILSLLVAIPLHGGSPRLVVFISVDQLKGDTYDRLGHLFNAGLARLRTEGIHFTDADLNYAPSETGPGHASMSTGTYPRHSGIISNEWRERESRRQVYCVEDSTAEAAEHAGGGVSPRHLLTTTIGDWLKAASPASKVYALSLKDRAAILMGGRHPDLALWYDRKTGAFVTNEYYAAALPGWVHAFNAQRWPFTHLPSQWTKLLPDSAYSPLGPDDQPGELPWAGSRAFPHPFDQRKLAEQAASSPFGNDMLLELAEAAVTAEALGSRETTDLLCVSLSSTDYIGHAFGADSHEMADNLVRLDRRLGTFLEFLEHRVGRDHLLVVLTADHGSLPLPEVLQARGLPGRRIMPDRDLNPRIRSLDSLLRVNCRTNEHLLLENGMLNYPAAARAGMPDTTLECRVRDGLRAIDGIAEVLFRYDLTGAQPLSPAGEYFRRGYHADRGRDFILVYREYCLVTSEAAGTSHGSPYRYDTHVPLLWWGPEFRKHASRTRVVTVDIAPTIARLVSIPVPTAADGHPIEECQPVSAH